MCCNAIIFATAYHSLGSNLEQKSNEVNYERDLMRRRVKRTSNLFHIYHPSTSQWNMEAGTQSAVICVM